MEKKLNLIGSASYTGYGVVTYNLMRTFMEDDWRISLFPKGLHGRITQEEMYYIDRACKNAETFDYDAPCLTIWHQFDLALRTGRGKYLAYPFFELDTFTDLEKHQLGYPDELIVSSDWAKEVVKKNGISTPTHVIPPGVDFNIFNPNIKPPVAEGMEEKTVFLNCGKWEVRKGHDFLIDAFHLAFKGDENVELWLLPTNIFLTPTEKKDWESLYMNSPLGKAGKIRIISWLHTHIELSNIMAQASCGVFPSRAEGWNLELLEMMALGKPVIATDYSAHTEFCNDENSMLIPIEVVEPAYDGKWFFEQGNWAKIENKQKKQLANFMRQVYEKKSSGEELSNHPGVETAKKYSWENCAKSLDNLLSPVTMMA